MRTVATILTVLLIAVHVVFFAAEWFLYATWPPFRQGLGFIDPPEPTPEGIAIA